VKICSDFYLRNRYRERLQREAEESGMEEKGFWIAPHFAQICTLCAIQNIKQ
jgi:hypothetical protein